jgi:hypothetical protein
MPYVYAHVPGICSAADVCLTAAQQAQSKAMNAVVLSTTVAPTMDTDGICMSGRVSLMHACSTISLRHDCIHPCCLQRVRQAAGQHHPGHQRHQPPRCLQLHSPAPPHHPQGHPLLCGHRTTGMLIMPSYRCATMLCGGWAGCKWINKQRMFAKGCGMCKYMPGCMPGGCWPSFGARICCAAPACLCHGYSSPAQQAHAKNAACLER